MDGIASVFAARGRADADTALRLFDVLRVDGHDVMAEPWAQWRKRLTDLLDGAGLPCVTLVAVSDDARALWDTWTALGGEGIVLKDRQARGDWGWAARMTLTYQHPRTGALVTFDEIVRVPQSDGFVIQRGATAAVVCWGVMPRGRLRHPVFVQ